MSADAVQPNTHTDFFADLLEFDLQSSDFSLFEWTTIPRSQDQLPHQ